MSYDFMVYQWLYFCQKACIMFGSTAIWARETFLGNYEKAKGHVLITPVKCVFEKSIGSWTHNNRWSDISLRLQYCR